MRGAALYCGVTHFWGNNEFSVQFSLSVVSNSLWPHWLYSPWNSPGQNTGVSSLLLLQGIFPTQVSCIAGGFFTRWATGKPKNIGMGNLSFLQRIFSTQESDQGLLHCWRSLPTELSGNNWSLNLALNSIDNNNNKKEQLLSTHSVLSPVLNVSVCSWNPPRSVILSSPLL